MISHIDMLRFGMKILIFTKVDGTLIVTMNNIFVFLHAKLFKEPHHLQNFFTTFCDCNICSTSIVDKVIHFCNLDCYDIVPPQK